MRINRNAPSVLIRYYLSKSYEKDITGYLSHGISTDNRGFKALVSGGIGAVTSIGDWNLNVGMMTSGSTTFHGGVSYFDGDFGASWHTTQYFR